MDCGTLDENRSTLVFRVQKPGTIEMPIAERTILGSAVTGDGFVVDVLHELESRRQRGHSLFTQL